MKAVPLAINASRAVAVSEALRLKDKDVVAMNPVMLRPVSIEVAVVLSLRQHTYGR